MNIPIKWTDEPIMKWSKGVKEADGYLHRHDLAPGTFNIRTLDDGSNIFTYVCPCGCGAVTFIGIRTEPRSGFHEWGWDGNRERPTLTPSLQQRTACNWHGFVRNGELVKA